MIEYQDFLVKIPLFLMCIAALTLLILDCYVYTKGFSRPLGMMNRFMAQRIDKKIGYSEVMTKLSIWFPQTDWTMIEDPTFLERVKKIIAVKYWGPLHFFLIRIGRSDDQANEILQRFFLKSILSAKLIQRADRKRGRFRTLLLTALKREMFNYLAEMGKLPSSLPENLEEKQAINNTAHSEMTLLWAT